MAAEEKKKKKKKKKVGKPIGDPVGTGCPNYVWRNVGIRIYNIVPKKLQNKYPTWKWVFFLVSSPITLT